jgi:hypothetical protein
MESNKKRLKPHLANCDDKSDEHVCPGIHPRGLDLWSTIFVLVTVTAIFVVTLLQIGAGAVNVLLLAPVWMQITHLFIADSLWIALVLLSAEAIAFGGRGAATVTTASRRAETHPVGPIRG